MQSQWGQDKWVCDLFNCKERGFFLDIGAYDGITISNTYFLEQKLGWFGILVEPNPAEFTKLKKTRFNKSEHACIAPQDGPVNLILNGWSSGIDAAYTDDAVLKCTDKVTVEGITFNTLFSRNRVPEFIDYMSLDIEGGEFEVLKTFPFNRHKLGALTVEHNAHLGPKNKQKQLNIRQLLEAEGYKYHHTHEADEYYVLA